jgi:hypothetical protein
MYRPELHVRENPQATQARFRDYTPVPLTRELCRLSSALLFSDSPKLTIEGALEQAALDGWSEFNRLDQYLSAAADDVAAVGSGAIRIVLDDSISTTYPLITFEGAGNIIWSRAHGRYTQGGLVVFEREDRESNQVVWRLLEAHLPGVVRRVLYKGGLTRLGERVGLKSGPHEFHNLREGQPTGVDKSTLIPWLNNADGESDIAGLDSILDALDDAETDFRKKSRASKPLTFVHRKLADEAGNANLDDAILVGEGSLSPVEEPSQLAQVVQGKIESADHVRYCEHLRELAVSLAGYSQASWGLEGGGRADSGRALKLRMARTLLSKAGKERQAREAIQEAAGVSLAMILGRAEVEPLKPEITFGTGLVEDEIEQAQELANLRDAGLISTRQALRELHPEWDEDRVEAELQEIQADGPQSDPVRDLLRNTQ